MGIQGSVRGGQFSIALFSKLLGLGSVDTIWKVGSVVFVEDHFEVTIEGGDGQSLDLHIEKRRKSADQRPFLQSPTLNIWYRGEDLPEQLEAILRQGMRGWGGLTVQQLTSLISRDKHLNPLNPLEDLEVNSEDEPLDPGFAQAERAARLKKRVGMWDKETTYADFLAIDIFDLLPYEAIEASNPFIRISHSDLECHRFMPREKVSNLNIVDFPWISRSGADSGSGIKAQEHTLSTDLVEHDVIMGCNARVCEVLDHVIEAGTHCPVVFANTCLPATTAEDVISVLKRYREKLSVPLLIHDRATADFDDDMFADLFLQPSTSGSPPVETRDPKAINLLGFTRDRALEELTELLLDLDIHVNTTLLPSLDADELARFPQASLNVIMRRTSRWDRFFEILCADDSIPTIAPVAPYGILGTRRWLEAILESLDGEAPFEQVWERHIERHISRWHSLQTIARKRRIIVAGRRLDIERLSDPSCTNGVPLLPLLEEMGFGIDVMTQKSPEESPGFRAQELFEDPKRHGVHTFDDLKGLRQLLRESDADAMVSSYTYDWRLTEAGKNRINLQHFEMGLSGAIASLRRLVEVCSTPFFKKYRRFLERDGDGFPSIPER